MKGRDFTVEVYEREGKSVIVVCKKAQKQERSIHLRGVVRVCGITVLCYFWCGVAVILTSKNGIVVFRVQAVCGEFKFYIAVVGEKIIVSW